MLVGRGTLARSPGVLVATPWQVISSFLSSIIVKCLEECCGEK
jgi:hypothetical protein